MSLATTFDPIANSPDQSTPVCPDSLDILVFLFHSVYSISMSINSRHTGTNQKTPLWPRPEVDYIYVSSMLSGLAKPRDRISRWLQTGELVRVKKGLYIARTGTPYSKEVLANLIYGPSYVSLEYALGYYGLIPERVEELTSVSLARSKRFTTPVGRFSYRKLESPRYAVGVTQVQVDHQRRFLIATPEKALADLLWFKRRDVPLADVEHFLFDEMRVDSERLKELNAKRTKAIAACFQCAQVTRLSELTTGRDMRSAP